MHIPSLSQTKLYPLYCGSGLFSLCFMVYGRPTRSCAPCACARAPRYCGSQLIGQVDCRQPSKALIYPKAEHQDQAYNRTMYQGAGEGLLDYPAACSQPSCLHGSALPPGPATCYKVETGGSTVTLVVIVHTCCYSCAAARSPGTHPKCGLSKLLITCNALAAVGCLQRGQFCAFCAVCTKQQYDSASYSL